MDFCCISQIAELDTARPPMKLFVDFHQRSLFKETAKHVKCATGYFVCRFDPSGFRHEELFVVRKFNFDSNVNIAVVRDSNEGVC